MNEIPAWKTTVLTTVSLLFPITIQFQEKDFNQESDTSTPGYLTHKIMAFYSLKRLHTSFSQCVLFNNFPNEDCFKTYKHIFATVP